MKDFSKLELEDKSVICIDCGATFIFGKGEQRYFLEKELIYPKRCRSCRLLRKLSTNNGVAHND